MPYKLIIFDLDGTLLDTLDDLADSVNYALKLYSYPSRTLDEIRQFVGNGIGSLINLAVPSGTPEEKALKVLEAFKLHYKSNSTNKTKPYNKIPELLKELKSKGFKLAVLSNKADFALQELVLKYFGNIFDYASGEREGILRKPAPDGVLNILNCLNIEKEHTVYIGDSEVDILTAKNSELDSVIVDWGFRDRQTLINSGAKIVVSTVEELKATLVK